MAAVHKRTRGEACVGGRRLLESKRARQKRQRQRIRLMTDGRRTAVSVDRQRDVDRRRSGYRGKTLKLRRAITGNGDRRDLGPLGWRTAIGLAGDRPNGSAIPCAAAHRTKGRCCTKRL